MLDIGKVMFVITVCSVGHDKINIKQPMKMLQNNVMSLKLECDVKNIKPTDLH
jgi:hypothetical protein